MRTLRVSHATRPEVFLGVRVRSFLIGPRLNGEGRYSVGWRDRRPSSLFRQKGFFWTMCPPDFLACAQNCGIHTCSWVNRPFSSNTCVCSDFVQQCAPSRHFLFLAVTASPLGFCWWSCSPASWTNYMNLLATWRYRTGTSSPWRFRQLRRRVFSDFEGVKVFSIWSYPWVLLHHRIGYASSSNFNAISGPGTTVGWFSQRTEQNFTSSFASPCRISQHQCSVKIDLLAFATHRSLTEVLKSLSRCKDGDASGRRSWYFSWVEVASVLEVDSRRITPHGEVCTVMLQLQTGVTL